MTGYSVRLAAARLTALGEMGGERISISDIAQSSVLYVLKTSDLKHNSNEALELSQPHSISV